MNYPFAPHRGLIIVRAELEGPSGNLGLRVALDTGATRTAINPDMLVLAGYDPAQASGPAQLTTASGTATAPRLVVTRIRALGQERTGFPVLCHTLPPGIGSDGLLGLDFLRGQVLTIDFRAGSITLT
jgi:predicted aspartyl protease